MLDLDKLKLKNIRFYKGRYVVRLMRRKKTLAEARKLQKYLEQYINCVNIYQDIKANNFIVQTYKEYNSLENAIKVRDFLTNKLDKCKT